MPERVGLVTEPPGESPQTSSAPFGRGTGLTGRETGHAAGSEITLAREIRACCLVVGYGPAQIAAEIHDRCAPLAGTTWIRAHRLALGISQADVVAQVRAWYRAEGRTVPRFSETLLSAYESGQKRPGPEYLHYLCCVYRVDPPDLGYGDQCFCGRGHRQDVAVGIAGRSTAAAPAPAHPDPVPAPTGPAADTTAPHAASREEQVTGPEDDDDVLRRNLLRLIADPGAPVDGQFFGAADRIRRRLDGALTGGSVSTIMLDEWEEATAGYGTQYMTMPPLRLLCDVLLDLGDVRRMSERRQPLECGERLCRLAGRLAGLAGMIMIDLGDQRLARSFFRTARTAADETGDRPLRAWVTVREALVPLYYGDPAEASALARAGASMAGRNLCAAAVMAPVIEARSLARMAIRRDAMNRPASYRISALLGQAHEALDRLPAADRSDTAFGYTERQLLFHDGDARVVLGDHRGAEKAFKMSLVLYARDEILDRSLITLGIARCRLAADEPEEALRLSRDMVLGLPRAHRSAIVVRAARSVAELAAGRCGNLRALGEFRAALISA